MWFIGAVKDEPSASMKKTTSEQWVLALPTITQADLRRDGHRIYLAAIVEFGGVEYRRNFDAEATEKEIYADFDSDSKSWRVI